MRTTPFSETQYPRQTWIWMLLAATSLGTWYTLVMEQFPPVADAWPTWELLVREAALFTVPGAITTATLLGVLALIGTSRLEVRIDEVGIHYRFFPLHWHTRTISWKELKHVYPRTYQPIREYGGWGIRFGMGWRRGMAINMAGNQGLQLVFHGGRRLLLGTQQRDAATAALLAFAPAQVLDASADLYTTPQDALA